jgi:CheY-like chemotaxis protein
MTSASDAPVRRVLLVEDDASISRFIDMALEDQGVDLTVCGDVESALAALQERPVGLVITDLMLPGLSGYDLVDRLHSEPALLAGAKVVIFSAGVNLDKQARLEGRGIWRILRKPASVAQVQDCVLDAFVGQDAAPPPADVPGQSADCSSADGDAVLAYFGGDAALFRAYRAKCLVQFEHDLAAGDAALRSGDLAALQRLSHSLATVFRTLGWEEDGKVAKQLEVFAAEGDAQASATAWARLRHRLLG